MGEIGERHSLGRVRGHLFAIDVKRTWQAVYFPATCGFRIDNQAHGTA